ncbi:STAS domain-containing protein [Lentzea sp. NPDC034063]|uniref:STAS domain-containing protein n=1 Tax=unclassified Lentzea TaxID=2643253 RepID=UPI0033F9EE4E
MPEHQFVPGDIPRARILDAATTPTGNLPAEFIAVPRDGWPMHDHLVHPPALVSGQVPVHRAQPGLTAPNVPAGIPALRVCSARVGAAVVVRVSGEVDRVTAPALTTALRAGCQAADPSDSLVVDLTGIRFFAVAGLAALVITHRYCRRRDLTMRVVATHRSVLMPLHVTGLDTQFIVIPDAA